jgi:hypothetical protein
MESKTPGRQRARVLVVGNSPIELNGLFEKLNVLENVIALKTLAVTVVISPVLALTIPNNDMLFLVGA